MTLCQHKFIRINDATKPRPHSVSWNGMIGGATAGCVDCGQVRVVYEDGTVQIKVEGTGRPLE
jgi:hypothetical protein